MFDFVPARTRSTGHYVTAGPAWRVHIVVVAELARTRDTVLLRLLGSKRVRLLAIADLLALPEGAWEKALALPWLARLSFEVPDEVVDASESEEERELIMETREWFEQFQQQLREQGRKQGQTQGQAQGQAQGRMQVLARQFEKRLGRALGETERAALAERLDRLGAERVGDVVLLLSAEALAAWLADPAAT
jgi:hypothetical protein